MGINKLDERDVCVCGVCVFFVLLLSVLLCVPSAFQTFVFTHPIICVHFENPITTSFFPSLIYICVCMCSPTCFAAYKFAAGKGPNPSQAKLDDQLDSYKKAAPAAAAQGAGESSSSAATSSSSAE